MRLLFIGFISLLQWYSSNCGIAGEHSLATAFQDIKKHSQWIAVDTVQLEHNIFHPQGMVIVNDTIYLSSVRVFSTRATGSKKKRPGMGLIYKFKMSGELLDSLVIVDGDRIHPGGMDSDGRYIWVPVAEYRPHSTASIYRINIRQFRAVKSATVNDHIGAVTYDPDKRILHGVNWGARTFYSWQVESNGSISQVGSPVRNGNQIIDYQDCHYAGNQCMLCAGLNYYRIPTGQSLAIGGIDLIYLNNYRLLHQILVPIWLADGTVLTRNPFFAALLNDRIRFYFIPEDNQASVYIYEVITGKQKN